MAWSSKQVLLFALFTVTSLAAATQPMFLNRAVNMNASPADIPQPVKDQYSAILSQRSLLIPLCPMNDYQVCPDDAFKSSYSLASLFSIGATQTGLKLQDVQNQWFQQGTTNTAGQGVPFGATPLTSQGILNSFHLLAIVNRLDLALWQQGKWTQSELRFIFGLNHPASELGKFTLIVEFVLPDMDWKTFQDQARNWKALGAAMPALPEGDLQKVIEQSGCRNSKLIRIRVNCSVGGNWRFSQWTFQAASKTSKGNFGQTPLDYQIDTSYAYTTLPQKLAVYSKFWADAHTNGITQIPVKGVLNPKTADYQFVQMGPFPGPPPTITDSADLGIKRDVIATQQCTGCHARETGNVLLQHVSETGSISGFLLPNRVWNPPLEDLTSMKATLAVNVHYCVTESTHPGSGGSMSSPDCGPNQTEKTEIRYFHDLARRKLFMATLLAEPSNGPRQGDISRIMDYAPDFAH